MWPFKKKAKVTMMPPEQISYSQLDITENFGDNLWFKLDDWMATVSLNKMAGDVSGLPPVDANDDEVYAAGARLSKLRESIPIPDDGVYCPVCHIANIQQAKLGTPCPKCGRALLKFGWG